MCDTCYIFERFRKEIVMKEHTKLSEEEVVKLKNTLLQLNGALLRLGINKEGT